MLLVLMNCSLSFVEIQAIVKVGGLRLTRLKKFESCENRSTDVPKRTYAFNDLLVLLFKTFFTSLDIEDRFACRHHCPKMHVIKDMTWIKLHKKYVSFVEAKKLKITDLLVNHEKHGNNNLLRVSGLAFSWPCS